MDEVLLVVNVAACLALSAACGWAVMSDRVKDGVLIKLGLIISCVGFMSVAAILSGGDHDAPLSRALGLLHIGLLVIVVGVLWRAMRCDRDMRRLSDWIDIEDTGRGHT